MNSLEKTVDKRMTLGKAFRIVRPFWLAGVLSGMLLYDATLSLRWQLEGTGPRTYVERRLAYDTLRILDEIDANKDCSITNEEVKQYYRQHYRKE